MELCPQGLGQAQGTGDRGQEQAVGLGQAQGKGAASGKGKFSSGKAGISPRKAPTTLKAAQTIVSI